MHVPFDRSRERKKKEALRISGDEALLRKTASGAALAQALKLAQANRQSMSWELKRMNESPKVMVARMSQLNPEGTMHVAQVSVRFDSDQVSHSPHY